MPDRPILFAYDGSEDARIAIGEAAQVLSPGPALVVTVWHSAEYLLPRSGGMATYAPVFSEVDQFQDSDSRAVADEGAALAREAGFEATALVARSDRHAWRMILDVAAERDARVIVTGSRGRNAVSGVLLGSVSSRIVHHADRPVLVSPTRSRT